MNKDSYLRSKMAQKNTNTNSVISSKFMVCSEVPKASQFKQAHKQQTEKYWKHRKSQLISILETLLVRVPGGHLGIFWVCMCRLGLQIGTPF